MNLSRTLEEVERDYISQILQAEGGQVELAARRLDIPRSTLYAKLKQYKLDRCAQAASATTSYAAYLRDLRFRWDCLVRFLETLSISGLAQSDNWLRGSTGSPSVAVESFLEEKSVLKLVNTRKSRESHGFDGGHITS